jgi:transketolase
MDLDPLPEKWRAFRWHVLEIDGHDFTAVGKALDEAEGTTGKPTIIVAHTVKGKGVSFMEGKWEWHGKAPNREEAERAIQELLATPV